MQKKTRMTQRDNDLVSQMVAAVERGDLKTFDGKNPLAVALGRMGGLKGGHARAAKLTSAQRSTIARNAAKKRWTGNVEKSSNV